MRAGLRGGLLAQVPFSLSRFRGGAIRRRSQRGLRLDRVQKSFRRRLRWALVSLRSRANDLAVHVFVAVGMNPFALHVVPTFR